KQVAQWKADLVAAEAALRTASPLRDMQRPAELQVHLREVLTDEAAAAWPCAILRRLPRFRRLADDYSRHSRHQGFTETVCGRRWRGAWQAQAGDDLDEDADFYGHKLIGFNGAYAINHPVQGSSAEVMMIALTRLDEVLRDEPAQLIATVHDEAVLLVPDDLAALERIGAVTQKEMIAAFLEVFPDAPTLNLVDPAVGPTWGDLVPLQEWLAKQRRA